MSEKINSNLEQTPNTDSIKNPKPKYPSFNPDSAIKAREQRQKQLEMIPKGDNYKTSSAIMSLYERYLNNAKSYRQKADEASRKGSTETSKMLKMAEIDEGSARLLEKILKEKYGIDPNSPDSTEETKKAS